MKTSMNKYKLEETASLDGFESLLIEFFCNEWGYDCNFLFETRFKIF